MTSLVFRKTVAGRGKLLSDSLTGKMHPNPQISPRTCKGSGQLENNLVTDDYNYRKAYGKKLPVTGKRMEHLSSSVPERDADLQAISKDGWNSHSRLLTGGGRLSTASNKVYTKGSKQDISDISNYNNINSVYKGNFLPFPAERHGLPPSSVPENHQHLPSKDDHIRDKREIGNYYKSQLNGQIYHLSVWCEGESSYTQMEPYCDGSKLSCKDRYNHRPDLEERHNFPELPRKSGDVDNQTSFLLSDLVRKAKWNLENKFWKPP